MASIPDMTFNQLADRYEQVCGEECRSRNKHYLIRRIAWRLQAEEEGGLSPETVGKARGLAVDADILGYDVDRTERTPKLVINGEEATKVRRIFTLYLELKTMTPVCDIRLRA